MARQSPWSCRLKIIAFVIAFLLFALGAIAPPDSTPWLVGLTVVLLLLTVVRWPAQPRLSAGPAPDEGPILVREPIQVARRRIGPEGRPPSSVEFVSTMTCPACGHRAIEVMIAGACSPVYECARCGTRSPAQEGHSCTLCSYGSRRCPPDTQGPQCG